MKTMKKFLILSVAVLSMSAAVMADATVGEKAAGTEGCVTSADRSKPVTGDGQAETIESRSGSAQVTTPPAPKK